MSAPLLLLGGAALLLMTSKKKSSSSSSKGNGGGSGKVNGGGGASCPTTIQADPDKVDYVEFDVPDFTYPAPGGGYVSQVGVPRVVVDKIAAGERNLHKLLDLLLSILMPPSCFSDKSITVTLFGDSYAAPEVYYLGGVDMFESMMYAGLISESELSAGKKFLEGWWKHYMGAGTPFPKAHE